MLSNDDLVKIDNLIEKRLSPMEKRLNRKLDKKLDLIISFFDKIVVNHTKRIDKLEKHTGIPPFE